MAAEAQPPAPEREREREPELVPDAGAGAGGAGGGPALFCAATLLSLPPQPVKVAASATEVCFKN